MREEHAGLAKTEGKRVCIVPCPTLCWYDCLVCLLGLWLLAIVCCLSPSKLRVKL